MSRSSELWAEVRCDGQAVARVAGSPVESGLLLIDILQGGLPIGVVCRTRVAPLSIVAAGLSYQDHCSWIVAGRRRISPIGALPAQDMALGVPHGLPDTLQAG